MADVGDALLSDRGVPGEAIAEAYDAFEKGATTSPMVHASLSTQTIQESVKLMLLVRAYQVRRCDGDGTLNILPMHAEANSGLSVAGVGSLCC